MLINCQKLWKNKNKASTWEENAENAENAKNA